MLCRCWLSACRRLPNSAYKTPAHAPLPSSNGCPQHSPHIADEAMSWRLLGLDDCAPPRQERARSHPSRARRCVGLCSVKIARQAYRSPAVSTPLGHKHPSRCVRGAVCGPRVAIKPRGEQRSIQLIKVSTFYRPTSARLSPQRHAKICRNRDAPRPRRPKLLDLTSRALLVAVLPVWECPLYFRLMRWRTKSARSARSGQQ